MVNAVQELENFNTLRLRNSSTDSLTVQVRRIDAAPGVSEDEYCIPDEMIDLRVQGNDSHAGRLPILKALAFSGTNETKEFLYFGYNIKSDQTHQNNRPRSMTLHGYNAPSLSLPNN